MNEQPFGRLGEHFGDMPDPRVVGRCDHHLIDIIMIAICAVLCGAETWEEVEEFGRSKETWLRQFLELPCGIPSHDTFRRVFSLLDGRQFQERFAENFAILRRLALNLLKRHPAKASLKRKRFRAALDESFLLELLTHV
jgi:predicted transposase YbfD/YdcC